MTQREQMLVNTAKIAWHSQRLWWKIKELEMSGEMWTELFNEYQQLLEWIEETQKMNHRLSSKFNCFDELEV